MAKSLGQKLPLDLLSRLTERNLSDIEKRVILLTTVDKELWPRHAMLSHYEVVAKDDQSILMLTYRGSGTTSNLLRNGNAVLLFVDEELNYYVRATCRKLGEGGMVGAPNEVLFSCKVVDVSEDKLPTAKILSGLTFSGYDPGMSKEDRVAVRGRLFDSLSHNS